MDNIIHLKSSGYTKEEECEHKIVLETPLDLGLIQEEPEEPETSRLEHLFLLVKYHSIMAHKRFYVPVRDYFYRRRGHKLVGKLMTLSARLSREDFNVFIRFSAHVNSIDVEVAPSGWNREEGKETVKYRILSGRLPGHGEYARMTPNDIKEAMKVIRSLSRLKHLRRSWWRN